MLDTAGETVAPLICMGEVPLTRPSTPIRSYWSLAVPLMRVLYVYTWLLATLKSVRMSAPKKMS